MWLSVGGPNEFAKAIDFWHFEAKGILRKMGLKWLVFGSSLVLSCNVGRPIIVIKSPRSL